MDDNIVIFSLRDFKNVQKKLAKAQLLEKISCPIVHTFGLLMAFSSSHRTVTTAKPGGRVREVMGEGKSIAFGSKCKMLDWGTHARRRVGEQLLKTSDIEQNSVQVLMVAK